MQLSDEEGKTKGEEGYTDSQESFGTRLVFTQQKKRLRMVQTLLRKRRSGAVEDLQTNTTKMFLYWIGP